MGQEMIKFDYISKFSSKICFLGIGPVGIFFWAEKYAMQNFTSFGPPNIVCSKQISWKNSQNYKHLDLMFEKLIQMSLKLSYLTGQKLILGQK